MWRVTEVSIRYALYKRTKYVALRRDKLWDLVLRFHIVQFMPGKVPYADTRHQILKVEIHWTMKPGLPTRSKMCICKLCPTKKKYSNV